MNSPNLDVIIMPTMACNLSCDYCYVLDKHSGVMDLDLAKRAIEQVVAQNDPCTPTNLYWHGAEPLLAGIEFYSEICAWTRSLFGIDAVQHHIQTNGFLLNDEWFDLFIQEHITTGVSLDGPPDLHDSHRRTRSGKGTFDRVFGNIMMAREKKLFFDVLCVITRNTLGREDELFDFFSEYKIDFGFEPIVPENEQMEYELAITPSEYAQVATRLFDRWFFQTDRRLRMVVPPYHYLMAILEGGNTCCIFSGSCANHYITVSPNGQVHSCIMFARHPELSYGNIAEIDLSQVLNSQVRRRFLASRIDTISECQQCQWAALCRGGCPHRAFVKHGDMMRPDAFCKSYQVIFQHVHQRVQEAMSISPSP